MTRSPEDQPGQRDGGRTMMWLFVVLAIVGIVVLIWLCAGVGTGDEGTGPDPDTVELEPADPIP